MIPNPIALPPPNDLSMSADQRKRADYQSLNSSADHGGLNSHNLKTHDLPTLKPRQTRKNDDLTPQNLLNLQKQPNKELIPTEQISAAGEITPPESILLVNELENPESARQLQTGADNQDLSYSELQKIEKQQKRAASDVKLINKDTWLTRHGHSLTYVGVYIFTIIVLFRPYELIPGLGFLSSSAFIVAIATLLIYLPTQLTTEGNLTTLSTEVKAVLVLTAFALFSIPIAKDPGTAWESFNDIFIKAVLIFIVMINVVRNKKRLIGLMWLSFAIGVYLSVDILILTWKGQALVEDYRFTAEVKGMFENPNELALHLVMMIPLVFAFGLAAKKLYLKMIYFAMAILMTAANFMTYSRGGFLGLIGASVLMVWKLGRQSRLKVTLSSAVVGLIVIALAPGNYGLRILSIFGLAADPNGSSDQRQELLIRSLLVTARNPWGIGMGNFPIVSIHMLVTHNAFTQVSSELGLLALAAYLIFMISPFRKLSAIERREIAAGKSDWFYYAAIGLQASLVAYWISSFFAAVAYNWFIYYLIAYAVAFRRVYQIREGLRNEVASAPLWQRQMP